MSAEQCRNGYIDTAAGYDFIHDDSVPEDDNGHGSHVAGTAAGLGVPDRIGPGVAPGASLMALKVLLHAYLGPAAYDERITRLANGTAVEQMGAYVMTADPVTSAVSAFIAGR